MDSMSLEQMDRSSKTVAFSSLEIYRATPEPDFLLKRNKFAQHSAKMQYSLCE